MLGEGTNWQDELFRNAFTTGQNLSITGGCETVTYAISGGYLNQNGIAIGSGFKRLSLRSNIDAQMRKWLKGGINFSLADSRQSVGTDQDVIMNALKQQPSVAVSNPDGSFDGPDDVWMPVNSVALASIRDNHNKKMNFRTNVYLEATIIDQLKLRTELSADYNLNKFYYYEPDYQFGVLENNTRTSKWTSVNTKYWSWRNILTYDKTFLEKNYIIF